MTPTRHKAPPQLPARRGGGPLPPRLARHLFGRAPRDSGIRSYVEPPRRTHLRRASLRRPFRESPNDSLDTSIPPLQGGSDSAYTGCTQDNLSVSVTTNNQLSSTGFSYDLAGNMTGDNTYTYGYNAESEIKSAAGVNYTYDGNRLEKNRMANSIGTAPAPKSSMSPT